MLLASPRSDTEILIESLRKELDEKYAPEMQLIAEQIKIKEDTIKQLKHEVESQKEFIKELEFKYQEDKKKTVALYEAEIQRLTQEVISLKLELDKAKFIRNKSVSVSPSSEFTLEDIQTLLIEDPRIRNRPLPFDSQPTRKFGGLAYTSSTYLGYVWYYGRWYQMSNELKFPTLSYEELLNKIKNSPSTNYSGMIILDDSFVPIINHNNRYFMRVEVESVSSKYKLKSLNIYCADTNKLSHITIYNNKFPSALHPSKLTFEDPECSLKDLDISD